MNNGSSADLYRRTNKKCNSDWIYIKDTVGCLRAYERTQLKLSVVYLDGKGNYSSR